MKENFPFIFILKNWMNCELLMYINILGSKKIMKIIDILKFALKGIDANISKTIRMFENIYTKQYRTNWVLNIKIVFRICSNFKYQRYQFQPFISLRNVERRVIDFVQLRAILKFIFLYRLTEWKIIFLIWISIR